MVAPTMMYVASGAVEFDKGGQWSSSDCAKLQNREQWSKWHCALMGSGYEHKCEQVLDPSYVPNPSNPEKIVSFELQQQFMCSVFAKTLVEGKAANIFVSTQIHKTRQSLAMHRKSMPICATSAKVVL